jgi:hypothetical protein
MASFSAAALMDLEELAHQMGLAWTSLDGEAARQLQVLDFWDGRARWVMDYEVELVVRNHISLIHLDPEFCGLSELCAFFTVVRGVCWALGWRRQAVGAGALL